MVFKNTIRNMSIFSAENMLSSKLLKLKYIIEIIQTFSQNLPSIATTLKTVVSFNDLVDRFLNHN